MLLIFHFPFSTRNFPFAALSALLLLLLAPATAQHIILAIGEPGQAEYQDAFTEATTLWTAACARAGADLTLIGTTTNPVVEGEEQTDHHLLQTAIQHATTNLPPADTLWLVLHGHGTFDGRHANFNLRGPDLSATELRAWLAPFAARQHPTVVINTTASSAPFLPALSATNRIVITATKSPNEDSYATFGRELAKAIGATAPNQPDLDHDGAVSLLEAFLAASREVDAFYRAEQRIRTEEALLDDNADRRGTAAQFFTGIRATKTSADGPPDGRLARQTHLVPTDLDRALPPDLRTKRDALESQLFDLRTKKSTLDEDAYYETLEDLLLQLAEIYRKPRASKQE